MLSAWSRAPFLDPAAITAVVGHVPPWLTQPAFQILKPMGQPSKVLRLFQSLDNAKFLDFFRCLETWINDNVSIPDGFFVDLINELYRKNGLVNGTLRFEGGFVQLANVKIPVFAIAAEEDHIVPHASATAPLALLGSDVTKSEVLPGGHIGVVVGSLARRRLWPAMLAWMEEHPIARAHPHIHARQP
jgi:polyhydroxyalkanoate synthase